MGGDRAADRRRQSAPARDPVCTATLGRRARSPDLRGPCGSGGIPRRSTRIRRPPDRGAAGAAARRPRGGDDAPARRLALRAAASLGGGQRRHGGAADRARQRAVRAPGRVRGRSSLRALALPDRVRPGRPRLCALRGADHRAARRMVPLRLDTPPRLAAGVLRQRRRQPLHAPPGTSLSGCAARDRLRHGGGRSPGRARIEGSPAPRPPRDPTSSPPASR